MTPPGGNCAEPLFIYCFFKTVLSVLLAKLDNGAGKAGAQIGGSEQVRGVPREGITLRLLKARKVSSLLRHCE